MPGTIQHALAQASFMEHKGSLAGKQQRLLKAHAATPQYCPPKHHLAVQVPLVLHEGHVQHERTDLQG